ncbi:Putative zinc-finger [Marininema mesophilum]|uniref:Anti-sigma-W factor RsiW n=1 Tax=Marininema mesophilum TaxID=1048340 RepID=A0A1H3C084_9BACL|nr:zf-HC2 domain-containing protein [Marininema mesophilum]SDX47476.1 Putative zinc-finger [Marininema mesophilum]
MSCKDMDRLIQLYVDQEINEQERQELQHHVAGCESCLSSLTEMITLVSSLEEIRQHESWSRPVPFVNYIIKWMAVYTVIILFVTSGPSLLTHRNDTLDQDSSLENKVTPQTRVTVLATQKENLHIPERENIEVVSPQPRSQSINITGQTAWIYPSAMPFLTEEEQGWVKNMKRLVLVHVPDPETLHQLFTSVGISTKGIEARDFFKKTSFPTSVILTTGKRPRWKTFRFPGSKQKVIHWFDKLASTPTIH